MGGIWVRPVNFPMNQMFGQIEGAAWGVTGFNGHPGCDYAGPMGSPVGAASAGQVTIAGTNSDGGFGFHPVCIYHPADNVTTLYGHMMAHSVNAGQQVQPGQQIGLMDSQGFSTGSHLHAELRSGNVPYGNHQNSMDIDAWLHAHGAYGGSPYQPAGALTPADRAKIMKLQTILKVHVDGAWGKQTDDALELIRFFCLNKSSKSTQVALLQQLWGIPQDGEWGPTTDKSYSLWRYVYLNK